MGTKKITESWNCFEKIMSEDKKEKIDMANFDWQKLTQEIRTDSDTGMQFEQDFKSKFKQKMAKDPLIPIGAGITAGVLCLGLLSFAMKRRKASQILMRARVVAQGFTVVAMVGAVLKKAADEGKKKDE